MKPCRDAGLFYFLSPVRNRRLAGLAEARKRIAAENILPLTMEEIEAEITADRTERRAQPIS